MGMALLENGNYSPKKFYTFPVKKVILFLNIIPLLLPFNDNKVLSSEFAAAASSPVQICCRNVSV